MKAQKILINALILLAGPAVTAMLYVQGEAGNLDASGVMQILVFASILTIVATTVSAVTHCRVSRFGRAMLVSVILSEILFVVLLVGYILFMPEGRGRAESLMWLPIMLMFMIPWALPTALSVSYGTGRIVRDMKRGRETPTTNSTVLRESAPPTRLPEDG